MRWCPGVSLAYCLGTRKFFFFFNILKKDQLSAIVLMKIKSIFKVLLKMVAIATSHTLLRLYFMPTVPALLQDKI